MAPTTRNSRKRAAPNAEPKPPTPVKKARRTKTANPKSSTQTSTSEAGPSRAAKGSTSQAPPSQVSNEEEPSEESIPETPPPTKEARPTKTTNPKSSAQPSTSEAGPSRAAKGKAAQASTGGASEDEERIPETPPPTKKTQRTKLPDKPQSSVQAPTAELSTSSQAAKRKATQESTDQASGDEDPVEEAPPATKKQRRTKGTTVKSRSGVQPSTAEASGSSQAAQSNTAQGGTTQVSAGEVAESEAVEQAPAPSNPEPSTEASTSAPAGQVVESEAIEQAPATSNAEPTAEDSTSAPADQASTGKAVAKGTKPAAAKRVRAPREKKKGLEVVYEPDAVKTIQDFLNISRPKVELNEMNTILGRPEPVYNDQWSEDQEQVLVEEWDALYGEVNFKGSSADKTLVVWKICLRLFRCSPLHMISPMYDLLYTHLPNKNDNALPTVFWSKDFCNTLARLATHPFWNGDVNRLTLAIQFAVICRTDDRRVWKMPNIGPCEPLDELRKQMNRIRGDTTPSPIIDMHEIVHRNVEEQLEVTMSDLLFYLGKVVKRKKYRSFPSQVTYKDLPVYPVTFWDLENVMKALDGVPKFGHPMLISSQVTYANHTQYRETAGVHPHNDNLGELYRQSWFHEERQITQRGIFIKNLEEEQGYDSDEQLSSPSSYDQPPGHQYTPEPSEPADASAWESRMRDLETKLARQTQWTDDRFDAHQAEMTALRSELVESKEEVDELRRQLYELTETQRRKEFDEETTKLNESLFMAAQATRSAVSQGGPQQGARPLSPHTADAASGLLELQGQGGPSGHNAGLGDSHLQLASGSELSGPSGQSTDVSSTGSSSGSDSSRNYIRLTFGDDCMQ
ncbi:hypothetical protein QQZ08_010339 [Neonectria magnoliae]|uniref:Uncharacterized protein n=1 Tax=Neonectria magnoliae TaxID=2732573 RepID=A0ABR1HHE9_9HYPO